MLRFDPWLFSGAEELVTRFFSELGAQLRTSKSARVRELADRFASYGDAVSPLAPLVFGRTGAAVVAVVQRGRAAVKGKDTSASEQRRELQSRLADVDRPIVVFIDDIDRLAEHEVREVVRLVKLVGDLPGVRYLLAFDRRRVELALGDCSEDGRAYLEKIVQAPHDLPVVGPARLRRLALEELNECLVDMELPFFSQDAWGSLYGAGVAPMLRTLRDARRFANVAPAALSSPAGRWPLTMCWPSRLCVSSTPMCTARSPTWLTCSPTVSASTYDYSRRSMPRRAVRGAGAGTFGAC